MVREKGLKGMSQKILITIVEDEVAPRFDLATEVLISMLGEDGAILENKTMVLARESAEYLCELILAEEVQVVICGGIEEEFYDYLTWKKVRVVDSVMGPWERALDRLRSGDLEAGDILHDTKERESHV
jgi:predicted Fe-Mo cluster-binding NifX family protein